MLPHLVQFYESDVFLFEAVAAHLREGLRTGDAAIAIAPAPHCRGFSERLTATGVDVEREIAAGRLVLLDAAATLREFMGAELPDRERFHRAVGAIFDGLLAHAPAQRVRAYGSMVDLLRRDGRAAAALALEALWNELSATRPIALLCGYRIDEQSADISAICAAHSQLCAPEPAAEDAAPAVAAVRALLAEIARRSELERELRAARAEALRHRGEIQSFLDEAEVPIHQVDARGVVLWANRAELALLGYAADEYIGCPLVTFHVDPLVVDDMLRRLAAGESLRDYEVRMRAKDGSIKYVLVTSNAQLAGRELVATRCFSRDITTQKHEEQERERAITELTRTVQLNEMFASVLGHDLRNPLNTIVMAAQMALGRLEDQGAARPLQRLLHSAGRMQRMIEQLLDFSRARMGGGIPLERKPMDLAVLARDAIEEMRVAHPSVAIELAASGDLRGDWDANRLAQVFSNLIGNAVQHGAANAPVDMRIDGTRAEIIDISIANRGALPADLLPILFAPFRGTHQRSAKSQGLGLGLFITNQIIEAHAGAIEAASDGATTTIAIRLPRRASISAAVRTSFEPPAARHPTLVAHSHAPRMTDDVLRLLVKGIRDYAIFMLDTHGYIISWNTGAQLINGYTAEEAIGQHFSIFYPIEDVEAGKCARELTIAARDGQFEEFGWRLRKDGAPFWSNVLITAIRDPEAKLVGFAKVTRDLTDERQIAELARQGEERFRLLVEGVRDYAIFMLDPEGHVTTWNAGAERIKGFLADEIIGKHFSTFYSDSDLRAGKPERELITAATDGRFEEEGWRLRKDGTRFWANVVITALYAPAGRLLGFAKVTHDLTERRRHEEERVRLAQAREAVRLRDEFLSIASHELKTPLTTVRLQLEALRSRIGDADRSVLVKLERTQRAGERLAELVDTLLDVSLIASGRFELNVQAAELAAIARASVDGMSEAAAAAGCALRSTLVEGLVGAWDRARIEQAITNLLANAIKYAAGHPIDVEVRQDGASAIIEVRDHGPGLPEGREVRLFERFERAVSMRHYGGLGLGLYVVGQIAEAHGGSATAANASGGGARFRLALPLQQPTKATAA